MEPPAALGRLERRDRIGVGGFASVWRYHDPELESDVAVKFLADNWAQRIDVRDRFLEEARILRRADSDHVVRVHDIGEVGQTPYFVMTYADLGSLARLLEEGPQPLETVLDLVEQAGAGLAVLHAQGVVHRDVKPQNLLRRTTSAGARVMVADLGVAKAMLHASGLTQVVGTPAYMAPEQAHGDGVDARADVHGLAAVAYHLLTGRVARDGGVADLSVPSAPPAPSSLVDVPSSVDEVLLAALSARRSDRPADVGEFVARLNGAGGGHQRMTLLDRPETTELVEPIRPRAATRRVLATAILSLVALAVGFLVAYLVVSAVA